MMKVLALQDGHIVEVEVACCDTKFVTLFEINGDPRGVQVAAVEQVQFINSTRSRVHMADSSNFVADGDVAQVLAQLTA